MMPRRLAIPAAIAIAVLAAAGAYVASTWTPTIPAEAASGVLARASVSDELTSECLERIERPGGWLDLCWMVVRLPDADATKDYYVLRVTGTLSGESGGVRWSALRARLVDVPAADAVFDGWPAGIEGPCATHSLSLRFGGVTEEACGHTSGEFVGVHEYQVEWICVGCLLPDRSERPVALHFSVAVPERRLPGWEIGADFGD